MINKTNTAIFLPLDFPTYKRNKINLLKVHLIAIKTLERIEKIKELEQIKTEKRRLLNTIIQELKKHYNALQKTLPEADELKEIKTSTSSRLIDSKIRETEINFHQNSRIDDELSKIQDKLKSLKI